jgi:hypothetical protein
MNNTCIFKLKDLKTFLGFLMNLPRFYVYE